MWVCVCVKGSEGESKAKEMEVCFLLRVVSSLCLLGISFLFLFQKWVKSERARRMLQMQGIEGPPPSLFFPYGNLFQMQKIQSEVHRNSRSVSADPIKDINIVAHDYSSSIFPYFEHWRKQYGT